MRKRELLGVVLACLSGSAMALDKVPLHYKPGQYQHQETFRDCEQCPELVYLQGGSFQMGSNENNDEKPVHEVTVEGFAIGKYEVTFAEYAAFATATGREQPKDEGWGRGKRPVIKVSWHDAVAYTEWLSQQTGKTYRLPTEAEWEYAARGGTSTAYWWGDSIGNNKANCYDCGSQWDNKQTAPVGSFAANPFGLYDTAGNVWEWTCSENTGDGYNGKENACSSNNDARMSLRGCAWDNDSDDCRSANRRYNSPFFGFFNVGFRLVAVSP